MQDLEKDLSALRPAQVRARALETFQAIKARSEIHFGELTRAVPFREPKFRELLAYLKKN
jgi:hypothetical protein